MPPVIVIGLDGVPFEMLDRYRQVLPNLSELRSQGDEAVLQSTVPPVTYPAWMSYASGSDPGELGVYDWQAVDVENRNIVSNGPTKFREPGFWEADVPALTVNLPGSPALHRPDDVTSVPGPGGDVNALPDQVINRLPQSYDVSPGRLTSDETITQIRAKFKAFRQLLALTDEPEIAHLTVFAIDGLMHYHWNDEECLKDAFTTIDEEIGRLQSATNNAYRFVVVSDHGMSELVERVDLNAWLSNNGYLTFESELDDNTVSTSQIKSLLRKTGVTPHTVKHVVPGWLINRIRQLFPADSSPSIEQLLDRVDYDRSKAVAMGSNIYLLEGADGSELVSELRGFTGADGAEVFVDVHRSKDRYKETRGSSPDVIVEANPGCVFRRSYSGEVIAPRNETADTWDACHHRRGILIGPSNVVKDMSITGLMPSLADFVGFHMPESLDRAVEESSGNLDNHLRSLGYLE